MAVAMEALLKINAQTTGSDGILKLSKEINGLGKGVKEAEKQFAGFSGSIAGLTGLLGLLAPALSVAGIAELGNKALEAGDKLFDMSQKTGISVEALARFSKAAQLNGTDIDAVAKASGKLAKGMQEAATTGAGPAAAALKALGISAVDSTGRLKGTDAVMLEVADRFKTLPDGAQKTAFAMELFGKSGADMIPMLNQGADAITNLGTKMTKEFAAKADEYHDRLTMLGGAVSGLGITVANVLLPSLIDLTAGATTAANVLATWFDNSKTSLQNFVTAVGKAALGFMPIAAAIIGIIGFYKIAKLAQDSWTASVVVFQSLSGPFGWAALAVGAGVATGTMIAMYKGVLNAKGAVGDLKKEFAALKQQIVNQTQTTNEQNQTIEDGNQKQQQRLQLLETQAATQAALTNLQQDSLKVALQFATTDKQRLTIIGQISAAEISVARQKYEIAQAQNLAKLEELQIKLEGLKADKALTEEDRKAKITAAQQAFDNASRNAYNRSIELQAIREVGLQQAAVNRRQAEYNTLIDTANQKYEQQKFLIEQSSQAIANQIRIKDATVNAEIAINNAAKTRLEIALKQATTEGERVAIINRIRAIELDTAKLQYELTLAQIQADEEEIRLKVESAKTKLSEVMLEEKLAELKGVNIGKAQEAVQLAANALAQTQNEYQTAIAVGDQKERAAAAGYDAARATANANADAQLLANTTGTIANNTSNAAKSMDHFAEATKRASFAGPRFTAPQGAWEAYMRSGGAGNANPFSFMEFVANSPQFTNPFMKKQFAVGGFVTGPTPALVGEAGPEYIIPATKMQAASASYLSGARGPAVLAGNTGTASAPQITIQTGPVMEFDGQRYVTLEDFQRGAQQIAEGVIGKLRTPSARLALGLS